MSIDPLQLLLSINIDYGTVEIDGLKISGVSGIIGDPDKPGRKDENEFLAALELVLADAPDLLVLHQGPIGGADLPGHELVTEYIHAHPVPLTICGHVHWPKPLVNYRDSSQILNVDSRAIVLTEAKNSRN